MANGKRIFGTILFFVALAITLGFTVLLYAESVNDEGFPGVGEVPTAALIAGIALGVVILILAILLIVRGYDKKQAAADDAEAFFIPEADRQAMADAQRAAFEEAMAGSTSFAQGADIVVYNLWRVPLMGRAWGGYERRANTYSYTYPRTVESAVYTNDYIPIDRKGTRLKLMTLLAGPKDADQKEFDAAHKIKPAAPKPAPAVPEPLPAAPPLLAVAGAGGQSFVQALEAETRKPRAKALAPRPEVYYDYPGDIHAVEDVEGIGVVFGQKLRDIGIQTTARLCYEDAGKVADQLAIARTTVEQWQSMAELMKVKGIGKQYAEAMARAGLKGIADLKKRSAAGIADQVNAYLDSLEVTVVGQKLSAKRIEAWQDAAKNLKRVRMQVPEN